MELFIWIVILIPFTQGYPLSSLAEISQFLLEKMIKFCQFCFGYLRSFPLEKGHGSSFEQNFIIRWANFEWNQPSGSGRDGKVKCMERGRCNDDDNERISRSLLWYNMVVEWVENFKGLQLRFCWQKMCLLFW